MLLLCAPGLALAQTGSPSPAAPATASATTTAATSPLPSPPIIDAGSFPVIDSSRLIPLLPEPPTGWSADKAEGSTTETAGFKITTVGRTYVQGDADNAPTATINIVDSANNKQFQDATKAMWGVTSDTPQGYDKDVTVNGLPGFEHFANTDQTGVLWVIAGGRFFVQVETTRLPATELQVWLSRLDLKKLAEMK